MKLSWTKGLDPEVVKDVKGDFKSSLITRNRLHKMLQDKLSEIEQASLAADNYKDANWAYKQADVVGYKRALRVVQGLLEDDAKE